MGRMVIDRPTSIVGNGIDLTVIEMTEDVLFDIVMDSDAHITIEKLTIRVVDRVVDSAIRYDGSGQVDHHPNVSLIADRTNPRLTLRDVNIEAKGSGHFRKAIDLTNSLGVTIENCSLNQEHNTRKGIAIHIDGFFQPVAFNILNCRILNFYAAIKSVEAEGLKIIGNNIVANTIGVQVANVSPQPEVNISDNHISSDLHNVHLVKANNAAIEGNLFFRREGGLSKPVSTSVFLKEVRNSVVIGNIFTSGNWTHIHLRDTDNITIGSNNHSNSYKHLHKD